MDIWQKPSPDGRSNGQAADVATQHSLRAGREWIAEIGMIRDRQDPQAFAALFRHFAPRLRAFLIRSGSSPEFAEDCTQDVLSTVWRKAHLFDPERASVATWVFAIARNRRVDLIRKVRRADPVILLDAVPEDLPWPTSAHAAQPQMLVIRQDEARLASAVSRLPDAQRRIVERAYFADLSHTEIAAETGLPLGTIKSRLRLALSRLRESMDDAEPRRALQECGTADSR